MTFAKDQSRNNVRNILNLICSLRVSKHVSNKALIIFENNVGSCLNVARSWALGHSQIMLSKRRFTIFNK